MTTDQGAHKQRTLSSHSSGGWKTKTRVPASWGSGESLLLSCRLLTSHCIFSWWRAERKQARFVSFVSLLHTNPFHGGSNLMTSFNPLSFQRPCLLIPSHWGKGFNMNLGRRQIFSPQWHSSKMSISYKTKKGYGNVLDSRGLRRCGSKMYYLTLDWTQGLY